MKMKRPIEHWKNTSLKNISEEINGVVVLEEWRSIIGYEGLYMVSNFGRIKSLSRVIKKRHKGGQVVDMPYKEFIVSLCKLNTGYIHVGLSNNKKYRHYLVHRLVGAAFLENKHNKPQINHKYGFKFDNRASMIEWSTRSENQKHSFEKLGRLPTKTFGTPSPNRKAVARISPSGKRKEYESITQAAIKNGVGVSAISNRLSGKYNHQSKHKWEYA